MQSGWPRRSAGNPDLASTVRARDAYGDLERGPGDARRSLHGGLLGRSRLTLAVGHCRAVGHRLSASPSLDSPHRRSRPIPGWPSIDAAQARWVARQPSTYAFTFTHLGPSGVGWNWRYRVTSLDGRVQVQALNPGPSPTTNWRGGRPWTDSSTRCVLLLGGSGDAPDALRCRSRLPHRVSYEDRAASDSDSTETVTDFVSGATTERPYTRKVLRSARAAWQRWEPTACEYVWRRFGAAARPGRARPGASSARTGGRRPKPTRPPTGTACRDAHRSSRRSTPWKRRSTPEPGWT